MAGSRERLIFDVGAHTGEDTDFYLRKGFDVVAVEANPHHVAHLRQRFASQIRDRRLVVESVAVGARPGTGTFLLHKSKSDWHRCEIDRDRFRSDDFDQIEVDYITFDKLVERHGVPYYLKIDIEGSDIFAIKAIDAATRPKYLSFEVGKDCRDCLGHLKDCGYGEFLIVTQHRNRDLRCSYPAQEGLFVQVEFTGHMSGLFGRELPRLGWLSHEEIMAAIANLAWEGGEWYDIHAR
jgi:FkbM family methyltransferase